MNTDTFLNGELYIKKQHEPIQAFDDNNNLINELKFEEDDEYSECESFWASAMDENGINMIRQTKFSLFPSDKKTYSNKEELEKHFMKLTDFLNISRYIGRYFKRTEFVKGKRRYMQEDKSILVLYATDDFMLIKTEYPLIGEVIQMINPIFIKDGNYKFYGEYNDKYTDKQALYKAITEQSIGYNKNKLK